MIRLTAELIEAFSAKYLAPQFDDTKPIPQFHRECWKLYCSNLARVAVAAPRGHAKSTALTTVEILAEVLFRSENYVVLVSSNEEMAIELLGDITRELVENEDLIVDFKIDSFLTQAKTDIVVKMKDGHQFRIIARGSGQKMRGRKWRGKRPGLIVCDDLEDDEQVESADRRAKFRKWFYRALIPTLRRGGRLRIHGTIMHEDSLLNRLMKDKTWKSRLYRAHASFDDFSEILWPAQFTEADLRDKRQGYIEQFDASGYSQEYLNDPFDNDDSFFMKDWFVPMEDEDWDRPMRRVVGVDFAVSKAQKANRSSITIAGQDAKNYVYYLDERVGRWDSLELIEEIFRVQLDHSPEFWFVEDGAIWKAIEPMVRQEMLKRNLFLNIYPILSVKDKKTNARSMQKRMKAGACRFHKRSAWYPGYEAELLRFTGNAEAVLDDQVDSSGIVCRGLDLLDLLDEEDFMTEEEIYQRRTDAPQQRGRSRTTGY